MFTPIPRQVIRNVLLGLLATVSILIAISAAASTQEPLTKVRISLDWEHGFQFAGFYAAIEKGYFTRRGLEVELIPLSQNINVIDSVTRQDSQFGVVGTEMLNAFHRGKDIQLVGSFFKRSPLVLLTRDDITSLQELNGKTLIGSLDVIVGGSLQPMLEFHQVNLNSLNFVPHQSNYVSLFREGKIDGLIAWLSNEPYQLQMEGLNYRIFDPNQFGITAQNSHLITFSAIERQSPGLSNKVNEALIEGWTYAIAHQAELVNLVLERYNTRQRSKETIAFEAREISKYLRHEIYPIGQVDPHFLRTVSERLVANKVIPELRDLNELLINTTVEHALTPSANEFFNSLTDEEKTYVSNLDSVTFQSLSDLPPYSFTENGKPVGMNHDYVNLLRQITGINFDYIHGNTWAEFMAMLESGELDLIVNLQQTPQRQTFAAFTPITLESFSSIVVKKGNDVLNTSLDKINEDKGILAVIKGFYHQELLRRHFPDIRLVDVEDTLEGLTAVSSGETDAFIGIHASNDYFISHFQISDLTTVLLREEQIAPVFEARIATNKDNKILHSVMSKAVTSVSKQQAMKVRDNWLSRARAGQTISLTQEELQYIKANPVIRFQNGNDYPPFNYVAGGEPVGFSIDVVKKIAEKTGMNIEFVQGQTWNGFMQMFRDRELDVMINIMKTPEREKYALFTQSFAETSNYAVTRNGEEHLIADLDRDKAIRIVAGKGYALADAIRKTFPEHELIEADDPEQALRMLGRGEGDVFIDTQVVINYYLQKLFLKGLSLTAVPESFGLSNPPLHIATLRDNPVLLSILDKGLAAIPETEWLRLRNTWFMIEETLTSDVLLTQQEKDFLSNIEILNVNVESAYMPFSFIEDDMEKGYGIDLINYLAGLLDINVEYVYGTWTENLQRLKDGQIDVIQSINASDERKQFALFTDSYISSEGVLALRKESGIALEHVRGLRGKTIAAVRGHNSSIYFEQAFPDITIRYYESIADCLIAVSSGEAFASFTSELTTRYLIQSENLDNLNFKRVKGLTLQNGSFSLAVHKDNKILRNILNKALIATPRAFLEQLNRKWFGDNLDNNATSNLLSEDEIAWLDEHDQQSMHLPSLGLPLGAYTDMGYQGINADFVRYIETKLGLSWNTLPEVSSGGGDATPLPDLTIGRPDISSQGRYKYSVPIVDMPVVVLTQNENQAYIDDLARLKNASVGLINERNYNDAVSANYPNLEISHYSDVKQAVMAVSNGEVQLLLCPLMHCTYLMDQLGISNVRIVGQTDYSERLAFGVRSDWPQMLEIINKTLSSMPEETKAGIYRSWNTREDVLIRTDYTRFWYLLVIALIVIATFVYWNRKIARYAERLKHKQLEVQEANQTVRALLDYSGQGVMYCGRDLLAKPEYSKECVAILGITPAARDITSLLFPEDSEQQQFVSSTLVKTLVEKDEFKAKVMLSLLPETADINGKHVSIEYRQFTGETIMVILTDRSAEQALKQQAESEHNYALQIISITTDTELFFETLKAFSEYLLQLDEVQKACANDQPVEHAKLIEIHRRTHTFKGLMDQFHLCEMSKRLHELEDALSSVLHQDWQIVRDKLNARLNTGILTQQLNHDLAHAKRVLGEKYTTFQNETPVSKSLLEKISNCLDTIEKEDKAISAELSHLVKHCRQLTQTDVKKLLQAYESIINNIATRSGKELQPFKVTGDTVLLNEQKWQPLLRALIHIFRNCIAHGIEEEDQRYARGKPAKGHISCHISERQQMLHLSIADDGAGIDADAVRASAAQQFKDNQTMADACAEMDWQSLIFVEQVSTADDIDMLCGRGVGLAAVKKEVENLNGSITVESEPGQGTTFYLRIPLSSVT